MKKLITYKGKTGQVYGIWFMNFLLGIVTLGIYRFWGITRMRKYIWQGIEIEGDRLEYTGRGKELFIGFLYYIGLLIAFMVGVGGVVFLYEITKVPLVCGLFYLLDNMILVASMSFLIEYIGVTLLYAFMFGVYFIAVASMLRYCLSRTRWRGIRFACSASRKTAFEMGAKYFLLNVVTLGFMIPRLDVKWMRYIVENCQFGTQKLEFAGAKPKLLKSHITSLLLMPVTLGLSRLWYKAKLRRYMWENTQLKGLSFKFNCTGGNLLGLYFGNSLILLFTLGLGYPLAIQRSVRYIERNLSYEGNLEAMHILSIKDDLSGAGEVLGEVADSAFDISFI